MIHKWMEYDGMGVAIISKKHDLAHNGLPVL